MKLATHSFPTPPNLFKAVCNGLSHYPGNNQIIVIDVTGK